ncbi:MAG: N-acetylmuramoyl-L-alanine amidase, partial [Bacteroidota bacterium]
ESYIIMSNYTSAYVIQSAQLSLKIQAEYSKKAGRVDKGVHRQSIWVLWKTAMPSVLTEIGFLTNPLEEQFLGSEKGQKYIAASIFNGFRKYKDDFEGNKKTYDDEFEKMEPLENENLKAGNTGKPLNEDYVIEEENGKSDSTKTIVKDEVKNPETPIVVKDTVKIEKPMVEKEKEPVVEKEKEKEPEVKKDPQIKPGISDEGPNVIEFKVQFASSDRELDLKESKFAAIENGGFYKVGSFLKYTSGKFKTMSDAAKHQKKLNEAGFKDCFVVAFRNGQRIDVKEARLLSEKK